MYLIVFQTILSRLARIVAAFPDCEPSPRTGTLVARMGRVEYRTRACGWQRSGAGKENFAVFGRDRQDRWLL